MPALVNKTLHIKNEHGGVTILTEKDQIAESTDVQVTCDSKRCASRHDGVVGEIKWNIEEVKSTPTALPDSFFRMLGLIIHPGTQEQKIFCSAGCVRDWLQYEYQVPLSPTEIAKLQENNQHAEAAKHRPNVVKFPGPKAEPTVDQTVVDPPLPIEPNLDVIVSGGDKEIDKYPDLSAANPSVEIKNGSDLDLA